MRKIYLQGAKEQIARHSTIRDINKQIVLNYVRVRAPISRAEIARETSLQRSTVSAIIDDLIEEGLIDEIGTGDSTGGRKPQLLQLKADRPTAIGVDVTPRETTVALADLTGRIIKREIFPTSSDSGFMEEQILSRVHRFASENKETSLEVGMSIPGIADQNSGRIVYIPYFHWADWDIAQKITQFTGLPVTIDNDANAVALAELWHGAEQIKRTRNFIMVLISEGIGTGIIIDGQVYRGESGAAGEFGHMFIAENAAVDCSCGRRDCWEAHASEKAIINRYISSNGSSGAGPATIEHLIALAEKGEKQAVKVVRETANLLGVGIANLIIGFSPQAIVVSGKIVHAWQLIEEEIRECASRGIRHELAGTPIVPSALGADPTVLGAITLVLSKKFGSAANN